MRENSPISWFLLILILIISLAFPSPVFAQSENEFTVAEQWVLDQIEAGNEADLETQFPDEADRILRSSLFKKLLDDPSTSITHRGIRIRNAIVDDALDFQYIQVDHEIWLRDCTFRNVLDLSESHFTDNIRFTGSTFSAPVRFFRMQVDKTLYIRDVVFEHSLDLRYANIGGNLSANNARFANRDQGANFSNIKVEGDVFLQDATFAGPVSFRYANIGNNFEATGAQFVNDEQTSLFGQMKVAYKVLFNQAKFEGPVNFDDLDIGNTFETVEAEFKNEKKAFFRHVKVGGAALLNKAIFEGPVDFRYSQVETNFEANETHFNYDGTQSSEGEQILNEFSSIRIGKFLFIKDAVFLGPVDFGHTEIGNNFEANGTEFNYDGELLNDFSSMKVGGSVLLNPLRLDNGNVKIVIFAGPVKFDDSDIGRTFEAVDVQFQSAKRAAFQHMKIGGATLLNNATFEGPVDFRYTQVETNFEAKGAKFKGTGQGNNFIHMSVGDTVLLTGKPCFKGYVSFAHSNFGMLQMQDVQWSTEGVSIDGMTYESIVVIKQDGSPDDWHKLIGLANGSLYNAQTYQTLESFFENQGYPERADEVYFNYKSRERKFLGSWDRFWNGFFGGFILYGRIPVLAFVWSLVPIALGTWVFGKKDGMIETSKKDNSNAKARPYYPLLYSLDSFLGPVDLGVEKQWELKPERKVAYVYYIFHKLAGWIFITIALFAVTGLVK